MNPDINPNSNSNPGSAARNLHRKRNFRYSLIGQGVIIGLITGLVISIFRMLLIYADGIRTRLVGFANNGIGGACVTICILLGLAVLITLLLEYEPDISGSGIPQVEAELLGKKDMNWLRVAAAKIAGCVLSIGGGLALGREGPSIQIGAAIGKGVARTQKRLLTEERYLMSCGAGAGLSAAFGAPLAGAIFCLEELHKNFAAEVLLPTMAAAVSADFVAANLIGLTPTFGFDISHNLPLRYYWTALILGVLLGLFGALYNWTIAFMQDRFDGIAAGANRMGNRVMDAFYVKRSRSRHTTPGGRGKWQDGTSAEPESGNDSEANVIQRSTSTVGGEAEATEGSPRTGLQTHREQLREMRQGGNRGKRLSRNTGRLERIDIGRFAKIAAAMAMSAVCFFVYPLTLGSGNALVGEISEGKYALGALAVLLVVKFLFSTASFGSTAPGGIFLPLLVLGAITGGLFSELLSPVLGIAPEYIEAYVVLAMAGYFAAIVQAPVTGVVLITEMTGDFESLLPLVLVALTAYIVSERLGTEPIYTQLMNRSAPPRYRRHARDRKIVIDDKIVLGADMDGKPVREMGLPLGALIISVIRETAEFIPDGQTILRGGDIIEILLREEDLADVEQLLETRCKKVADRT